MVYEQKLHPISHLFLGIPPPPCNNPLKMVSFEVFMANNRQGKILNGSDRNIHLILSFTWNQARTLYLISFYVT